MTGFGDERLSEMDSTDNDLLDIDCSRCGKPLKVRLADLGDARFVECEACAAKPPFNERLVFVAFG